MTKYFLGIKKPRRVPVGAQLLIADDFQGSYDYQPLTEHSASPGGQWSADALSNDERVSWLYPFNNIILDGVPPDPEETPKLQSGTANGCLGHDDQTDASWTYHLLLDTVLPEAIKFRAFQMREAQTNSAGRSGWVFYRQPESLEAYRIAKNNAATGDAWQLYYIAPNGDETLLGSYSDGLPMGYFRDLVVKTWLEDDQRRIKVYVDGGAPVIDVLCESNQTIATGVFGDAIYGPLEALYRCKLEVWTYVVEAPFLNLGNWITIDSKLDDFPQEIDPADLATNMSTFFEETWEGYESIDDVFSDNGGPWDPQIVNHQRWLNDEEHYWIGRNSTERAVYNPYSVTTFTDGNSLELPCMKITPAAIPSELQSSYNSKGWWSGIISRFSGENWSPDYGRQICWFAVPGGGHGIKEDLWWLPPVLPYRGWPVLGESPEWPPEDDGVEAFSQMDGSEGGPFMTHINLINQNVDSQYSGASWAQFTPPRGWDGASGTIDGAWFTHAYSNQDWVSLDRFVTRYAIVKYFNGVCIAKYPNPRHTSWQSYGFHIPMSIIFDIVMGGDWPGTPSGDLTSGGKFGPYKDIRFD